jgi:hypothetical protein
MPGLLDFFFNPNSSTGLLGLPEQQNLPGSYNMQAPQQRSLLEMLSGGIDRFGGAVQGATDNPLFHLGMGLASGKTAGEGIGAGLTALNVQKKQADQKQLYALAMRALAGGLNEGQLPAPGLSAMPNAQAGPLSSPAAGQASPGMSSPAGARPGMWGEDEAVKAGLYDPLPAAAGRAAAPQATPSAGPPKIPPLTMSPTSSNLRAMISVMAHPDLQEGPRKAIEMIVGKQLDNDKLTDEQKNYMGYYNQSKASGAPPIDFKSFIFAQRHAPSISEVYGPGGQPQKVIFDPTTLQTQNVGGQAPSTAETERQKIVGEAQGKSQASLPNMLENANFMLKSIDDVTGHPGKYFGTGPTAPIASRIPGTSTYNFGIAVDQLRGKTFLEAFNSLRGAGAITEKEGSKATNALARLDTMQSESAFNAALKDLREVVQSGAQREMLKSQRTPSQVAPILENTGPQPPNMLSPRAAPKEQGQFNNAPPPQAAVDLRNNPRLREQFDAKYGAGSSAKILGY